MSTCKGVASMSVPVYIAESACPDLRGRLVTLNTIFITGGQFVASAVCGGFSSHPEGWRMAVSDRSDDPETETEMKKSSEEEYVPPEMEEPTISTLNKVLTPLGQSPVTKRKLSRVKLYAERKARAVNESVHEMLNVPTKSEDGEEIISQFKEKFKNVNTENEKYLILTCLRKSWIENKIMTEFGVSLHVARTAKITQVNKEHEEEVRRLNAERFVGLKTVSGTRGIHSVIPVSENKIAVKTYSGSPENPREVAVVKRAARGRGGESV
ncbi:hypothetical protein C0J52_11834 [Blattella germanica]|nr:hypothetical protein C0J52_11834 [Blattella germanica]